MELLASGDYDGKSGTYRPHIFHMFHIFHGMDF
jgi:hypothetical protein